MKISVGKVARARSTRIFVQCFIKVLHCIIVAMKSCLIDVNQTESESIFACLRDHCPLNEELA